jgi:hypothetical protein
LRACVRACCCAEQAGVCAAIDLLDELVTEHELWVLPCRDPIGLSGYRHALHLGLVTKKRLFPTCVENIKTIIYQDRLGTNARRREKTSHVLCVSGVAAHFQRVKVRPCDRPELRIGNRERDVGLRTKTTQPFSV